MAKLDPRTDSFIALLLDVSGRARPEDVNGVPADEAADLLQQYAAAHPERSLVFDGAMLAYAAAPAPAPVPAPATEPVAVPAPALPADPVSAVPAIEQNAPATEVPEGLGAFPGAYETPQPVADPTSAPANPELPSWVFEGAPDAAAGSGYPMPEDAPQGSVPEAPAHEAVFTPAPAGPEPAPVEFQPGGDYGVPQAPAPGGYYGVSDAAPPEYLGAAVADNAPAGEYAPPSSLGTMDYVMSAPVAPEPVPTRVNGLWWLAVLFFGAPGAFVAWFVNRGRTGSKTFLWVGIVLTVIAVVAFGLAFTLLGSAIFMAAPNGLPAVPAK